MARSPFALWWDAAGASYNLMIRTGELAAASVEVMARRTDTIRTACHDPVAADYPELFGMVTEKVEAFTRANLSLLQDLAQANVELLAKTARAGRMTPSTLAAESLRAHARASRAAERAMQPIHQRATANARRLGRKKHRAG